MWFVDDIGIDLGTASVLVYEKKRGIVLHEPSVVAINNRTGVTLAVGEEARKMLGRTPHYISAIRPLREGVVADYDTTEKMLSYFLRKSMGRRFFKPRVIVCIPTGATDVEERAVRQATLAAGAKQAFIIEEPVAAALGAGINIAVPFGNMVVDIGGGTSDIAVLSLGGIVCDRSLRVGGDKFDEALIRFVRREHQLMIGDQTAEEMKRLIGTVYITEKNRGKSMEIRGRDLSSGLPKTVTVTAEQTQRAMMEPANSIVSAVHQVLEATPPELAADIVNNGIVMTGGGALLNGLDRLLSENVNLPVHIADEAISCVARGTGRALKEMDLLSRTDKRGVSRGGWK
ncbi:MAG: rod shape-determining protein MreB [Syntrophomonadaceae bacterium]|nr:rod shape-determining protein MreB [Syntrophomonadaceae bacterium]